MIGERFHRLLVVAELPRIQYTSTSSRQFLCQCDCGNTIVALPSNLRAGRTKSCGCWKKETAGVGIRKHGKSQTDEYRIWAGILKRCRNKNMREFHLWGGRGITICERWHAFENFLTDMGPRPSKYHSIDRINNDGNYEPGNCRWATPIEQAANTRRCHLVEFRGGLMTVRQFAKTLNHSYYSIYDWVVRRGMTPKEVCAKLSIPR